MTENFGCISSLIINNHYCMKAGFYDVQCRNYRRCDSAEFFAFLTGAKAIRNVPWLFMVDRTMQTIALRSSVSHT